MLCLVGRLERNGNRIVVNGPFLFEDLRKKLPACLGLPGNSPKTWHDIFITQPWQCLESLDFKSSVAAQSGSCSGGG
jgi:hypothetical protein